MGRIICAGLGPGDPDLISVKADRTIRSASHVAFFRKAGRQGQARRIAAGLLRADAVELAMEYPLTTELPFDSPDYVRQLAAFYDTWADRLADLARSTDIVVLCEGDPFLYGSFMHLHARLQHRASIEVIPGISGMSGCWTATGRPITWGDDVLCVLTGTLPEDGIARHAETADALVVMKIGRNLPKVRRALDRAGRLSQAWLIERGTMPGQRITPLAEATGADCPYFALVVVHGHGRRPEAAPESVS